jgi:hypothetical protein
MQIPATLRMVVCLWGLLCADCSFYRQGWQDGPSERHVKWSPFRCQLFVGFVDAFSRS